MTLANHAGEDVLMAAAAAAGAVPALALLLRAKAARLARFVRRRSAGEPDC